MICQGSIASGQLDTEALTMTRNSTVVMSIVAVLLLTPFQPADAQQDPPKVCIIGWVEKQGAYAYVEGQTVGSVIEAAGGLSRALAGQALRAYVNRMTEEKLTACLATFKMRTEPADTISVTDLGRGEGRPCPEPPPN